MAPVHDPHLPADHACLIVHGSDKPGIVAVTASGRRFVDESVSYHRFVRAMYAAQARDGGSTSNTEKPETSTASPAKT